MRSKGQAAPAETRAWSVVPLGEIAEVKLGKMLDKTKHRTGRRLPYLRNINVRWGTIETDDLAEMHFKDGELDRFGLEPNDVLVCEGGEPGRAAVWNGDLPDLKFQKALHRVRFRVPFDPRFLVYYLEFLTKAGGLERRFTGSTIKHLTREAFVQLPVPHPLVGKQQQIVAEVEKQFTRLDAAVAALLRARANLRRYRGAILTAACEGRLVATEIRI
jgi:type I restriction enzyme, S subunit